MTASIRQATSDDAPAILGLMREMYASEDIPFDPLRAEPALATLLAVSAHGFVLIAEQERVIGYIVATMCFSLEFGGRFVLIDEVFIRPESRGGGIGSQLVETVLKHARGLGVQSVRLEAGNKNVGAIRLYSVLGFVKHGRDMMTRWL